MFFFIQLKVWLKNMLWIRIFVVNDNSVQLVLLLGVIKIVDTKSSEATRHSYLYVACY